MQPATRLRFRLSPRFFYPTGRNPIGYIIFFNLIFIYKVHIHARAHAHGVSEKVAGCRLRFLHLRKSATGRNLQPATSNVFTFYLKHLDVLKQTPWCFRKSPSRLSQMLHYGFHFRYEEGAALGVIIHLFQF